MRWHAETKQRRQKQANLWPLVMEDTAPVMARSLQRISARMASLPAAIAADDAAILGASSSICSFLTHSRPPLTPLAPRLIEVTTACSLTSKEEMMPEILDAYFAMQTMFWE